MIVDMYFRYIQSGVGALSKKQSVRFVIPATASSMICGGIGCGIWMLVGCVSIWSLSIVGCCAVKQEMMPWLAGSGRFTKRFERVIGRQCRELSVARVAQMNNLGWDQVRRIEKNYMRDLLARHLLPRRLRAIGIDEISIRKRHTYAGMVDRHWDGIAAYCRPENKVSLGFVEGLNNKIREIQRRVYGLRDEEYLRLKIRTCMLPEI
ncbi:ISL3 family transposase [candidate division WOR-3 bacterium]|nr:ISL3 family transposase [candidate division WOR-3 bacterium]